MSLLKKIIKPLAPFVFLGTLAFACPQQAIAQKVYIEGQLGVVNSIIDADFQNKYGMMPVLKLGIGTKIENFGLEFYMSGAASETSPQYFNGELGLRALFDIGKKEKINSSIGAQVSYDFIKEVGTGTLGLPASEPRFGGFIDLNFPFEDYILFLEGAIANAGFNIKNSWIYTTLGIKHNF
jgi:hypothetical protein